MRLGNGPTALQMLCDALGDGVLLVDADERIRFASEPACRILASARDTLLGESCEHVLRNVMRTSKTAWLRLQAGESVACDGPDGLRNAFVIVRIHFPEDAVAKTVSEGAIAMALVIRDQRVAQQLRRFEDVQARTNRTEALRPGVLGHRRILRELASETRRSHRDGQPLCVLLMQVPAAVDVQSFCASVSAMLRDTDRLGMLDAPDDEHDEHDGGEVTVAEYLFPLNTGYHFALLVLPCTPQTGGHALAMRVRAQSKDKSAPRLAMGVACLRSRSSWDGDGRATADTAAALLERAFRACGEDRKDTEVLDAVNRRDWQRTGGIEVPWSSTPLDARVHARSGQDR